MSSCPPGACPRCDSTYLLPEEIERLHAPKSRLYLAGPMRGYKEYNFPAFHAAAARLRELGYEVWSPAERDEQEDGFDPKTDEAQPIEYYMRHDLPPVIASDAIAVLPGWQQSVGARNEVQVARMCGLPVLDADTLEPIAETIMQEAQRLVYGERGATYSHPADDFGRTAALWNARFAHMLMAGEQFVPEDIAAAMRLVKESRLVASPRHRDSLVDIAGYAGTQELVWERDAARG